MRLKRIVQVLSVLACTLTSVLPAQVGPPSPLTPDEQACLETLIPAAKEFVLTSEMSFEDKKRLIEDLCAFLTALKNGDVYCASHWFVANPEGRSGAYTYPDCVAVCGTRTEYCWKNQIGGGAETVVLACLPGGGSLNWEDPAIANFLLMLLAHEGHRLAQELCRKLPEDSADDKCAVWRNALALAKKDLALATAVKATTTDAASKATACGRIDAARALIEVIIDRMSGNC